PEYLNAKTLDAYRRSRGRTSTRKWLLTGSLRVPIPALAVSLAVVFGLSAFAWRGMNVVTPPPTRIVVETRIVEVPVVQERVVVRTVYRDRPAEPHRSHSDYQFVTALTPRIERRANVNEN
ncbi:MAG TPA: hypothetical protein VGK34_09725, partial [Armatimonadota bacterium]